MRFSRRSGAAAALLLAGPVALAHHSFGMFDLDKDVTVEAVVKEFQFTNPHVWIQIMVPDGKGGATEWSIEAGAPGMMIRNGWKGYKLKPGDKVTLTMHPLKSGDPSGSLIRVIVPDGRVLGSGGGPPPPPPKADRR
jgi:Family of unknown function (DUF6152)